MNTLTNKVAKSQSCKTSKTNKINRISGIFTKSCLMILFSLVTELIVSPAYFVYCVKLNPEKIYKDGKPAKY